MAASVRRVALASLWALWCVACPSGPGPGGDASVGTEAGADTAAPLDAPGRDGTSAEASAGEASVDAPATEGGGGGGDPLAPSLMPPLDMDPSHYPSNVWTTSSLEKVQPTATPGATHWVSLSAARNEFESFQVHVRATAVLSFDVSVSDLVDARSGDRIPADARVLVSRPEYLNITQRSDANGALGRLPDPLIPSRDPYVHEARNAFPAMVPAGETRSAWIDVHVPPGIHSGWYTGSVTVRSGGATLATIPVRLGVWDFDLPSTASLRSAFGLSWNGLCVQAYGDYARCAAYPGARNNSDTAVELTHVAEAQLFLDHRVSLGNLVYAGPTNNDWTHFDSVYAPLFNGTAGTRLAGARQSTIQYVGDVSSAPTMQRWVDHFRASGWLERLFEYHCDEPPNGCAWNTALSEANAVHAASPDLRTILTTDLAGATSHGLLDAIDILVPVVDYLHPRRGTDQRPSYDAWLARPNKHLWWYQSCDQHESCTNGTPGPAASTWPSYMVDATPVRNRVFQWMAYLYRVEGELYYATDYCWTSACGAGTRDPWTSVYAFGGNGDGTLFYPGTVAHIGGTTPVPVSSLRLVYLRDGMEDYEYLRALASAGDDAFAQSTARSFITNAFTFDNDPARLAAAREALGARLHARAHP